MALLVRVGSSWKFVHVLSGARAEFHQAAATAPPAPKFPALRIAANFHSWIDTGIWQHDPMAPKARSGADPGHGNLRQVQAQGCALRATVQPTRSHHYRAIEPTHRNLFPILCFPVEPVSKSTGTHFTARPTCTRVLLYNSPPCQPTSTRNTFSTQLLDTVPPHNVASHAMSPLLAWVPACNIRSLARARLANTSCHEAWCHIRQALLIRSHHWRRMKYNYLSPAPVWTLNFRLSLVLTRPWRNTLSPIRGRTTSIRQVWLLALSSTSLLPKLRVVFPLTLYQADDLQGSIAQSEFHQLGCICSPCMTMASILQAPPDNPQSGFLPDTVDLSQRDTTPPLPATAHHLTPSSALPALPQMPTLDDNWDLLSGAGSTVPNTPQDCSFFAPAASKVDSMMGTRNQLSPFKQVDHHCMQALPHCVDPQHLSMEYCNALFWPPGFRTLEDLAMHDGLDFSVASQWSAPDYPTPCPAPALMPLPTDNVACADYPDLFASTWPEFTAPLTAHDYGPPDAGVLSTSPSVQASDQPVTPALPPIASAKKTVKKPKKIDKPATRVTKASKSTKKAKKRTASAPAAEGLSVDPADVIIKTEPSSPTSSQLPTLAQTRERDDALLQSLRQQGLTYEEIVATGQFGRSASTLRGRMGQLQRAGPTPPRKRPSTWPADDVS